MRSLPEWIGKTDDDPIPPRVKLRVFEKAGKQCSLCGILLVGRMLPEFDHRVALINGGKNRESNIVCVCSGCHRNKTKKDVREKSVIYNKRIKRLKLKNRRRLIPGSKGSGYRKKLDGTVIKE